MTVLDSLAAPRDLRFFETLADIPRGSGNEKQVADWVVEFATERGLEAEQDELHCVLVKKPGQHGLEDAPPLILHGHLDMVCEKEEGVDIDFEKEPIRLVVDGDYITADGTSLGADNGIGVSYILALLDSQDIPHPPLEAVLTAMEEKGKVGAAQFDTSRLAGKRMIDFNWITDKEILAGCSGDVTFTVDVPGEWEAVPASHRESRLAEGPRPRRRPLRVRHPPRACQRGPGARPRAQHAAGPLRRPHLPRPFGGAQNNAIPADAQVVLALRAEDVAGVEELVDRLGETPARRVRQGRPRLRLELERGRRARSRCSPRDAGARFARLTALVPNGVLSWSLVVPGIVESSNNLGTVRPTEDGARLMATITAAVTSRKHEILDRVRSLAALAGGGVDVESTAWTPPSSPTSRTRSCSRSPARPTATSSARSPRCTSPSAASSSACSARRSPAWTSSPSAPSCTTCTRPRSR